jgi:hypothetical protein
MVIVSVIPFNVQRSHVLTFPRSTFNVRNSSAAWRSAIEIASGRLFAGRPPAWTLPRRPHRRSPGAKRPLRRGFNRTPEQLPTFQRSTLPRSTFNVRNSSAAWRSAIEIASGRLFAGRPPAWTLPRRPHRRSPGAKRPLRRGFNRTPEQLPTFQRSTLPRSHVPTFPRSTLPRSHVPTFNVQRSTFNVQPSTFNVQRSHVQRSTFVTPQLPGVQRLKSPLEGFSPGVHLRGRCHGDRIGGRPARSVLSGAVSTARLSSCQHFNVQRSHVPTFNVQRSTFNVQPSTFNVQRSHVQRSTFVTPQLPGVQRLKSPLEGFSPGVHLRGRCHGDRIGGRPARSVLSGAVSTARLSSYQHFNVQRSHVPTFPRSTLPRSHVPPSTFNVQRSNLQPSTFPRSTFNVQRSNLQRSTFNVQPSTFHLQRSTFQPSTFNVQRSTFNLQRSTFNVQPSTLTAAPAPHVLPDTA